MKLTYKQIINAVNPLSELSNKEMDYGLALKISRNMKELEKHYIDYQEELQTLQEEYLDRDEYGNFIPLNEENTMFKIKDGLTEELNLKIQTLNDFEVEAIVYMLHEEDFKDLKITPSLLMGIDFLIEEADKI